jgi:hypothetical protein
MSIAPAPCLEACLAVLYRPCINGRLIGVLSFAQSLRSPNP